jgi:hypothetical protein
MANVFQFTIGRDFNCNPPMGIMDFPRIRNATRNNIALNQQGRSFS